MTAPEREPFFSVVIPVRDGGPAFALCLAALGEAGFDDRELIVVDDGSTDGSAGRARAAGARVLETSGGEGPAAARNRGAREARGRALLFLDADCAVHDDTLERTAAILRANPDLDAVFGSYDDRPADPGLVSRFRNLLHHWTHQRGRPDAGTFWAGCGAIRRLAFQTAGGFDAARYPRPSVEDIELGVRLRARGHRLRLAPEIQVTHLKAWSLGSMVRTDALGRAAPWTELALSSGGFPRDLNVGLRGRAGLLATWAGAAGLAAAPWRPALGVAGLAAWGTVVLLHLDFLRLLARTGGARLAAAGAPLLLVHYAAGGAGLAVGALRHLRRGSARKAAEPAATT